jgi:hypothetical protein
LAVVVEVPVTTQVFLRHRADLVVVEKVEDTIHHQVELEKMDPKTPEVAVVVEEALVVMEDLELLL